MGQISHPHLGSPHALVTAYGELVVTGSKVATNSDILGNVQVYDQDVGPLELDNSTHAINTIEYEHHEVHGGGHYFVRGYTQIASSGDKINFAMTTPNTSKWVHLKFDFYGNDMWRYQEFEGATISGGGAMTPYNSNRNATTTSTVTLVSNCEISGTSKTSGTLLAEGEFGAAGTAPSRQGVDGGQGRSSELVLKSGTDYFWEFTAGANTMTFTWDAEWYEHTDKTTQF